MLVLSTIMAMTWVTHDKMEIGLKELAIMLRIKSTCAYYSVYINLPNKATIIPCLISERLYRSIPDFASFGDSAQDELRKVDMILKGKFSIMISSSVVVYL